mmetsp:Transcript_54048/g.61413  ORF Transcript_54048/g.61413 Transcript_54048/m.61413 type:complete len:132 (+) Transcript_54048:736-1131(+)
MAYIPSMNSIRNHPYHLPVDDHDTIKISFTSMYPRRDSRSILRKHGNRIDRHHLHQEDLIDRWSGTVRIGCSPGVRGTPSPIGERDNTVVVTAVALLPTVVMSLSSLRMRSRKKGGGTRVTMSSHSSGPGC